MLDCSNCGTEVRQWVKAAEPWKDIPHMPPQVFVDICYTPYSSVKVIIAPWRGLRSPCRKWVLRMHGMNRILERGDLASSILHLSLTLFLPPGVQGITSANGVDNCAYGDWPLHEDQMKKMEKDETVLKITVPIDVVDASETDPILVIQDMVRSVCMPSGVAIFAPN